MITTAVHRHGGHILSATLNPNNTVTVFDRPATHAGLPGTVTADESATWGEDDWRRLARSRHTALRARQRAANLRGPRSRMSAAYQRQVAAERAALGPKWAWRTVSETEIDHYCGTILVESFSREQVLGLGLVWAWYPAGHALPAGYQRSTPGMRP